MTISLEKRAEKVKIILEKRKILKAPTVRVGMAVDISGSTRGMYNRGVMQEVVDRLLAVASKFDDNGELDMWTFDNETSPLEPATAQDYGTYVTKKILNNDKISKWGGTSYAPIVEQTMSHYFPRATSGFMSMFKKKAATSTAPAMVMIITDGSNNDRSATAKLLREAAKNNVYWSFVGVGDEDLFTFIKDMADELPNVGFVNMASLEVTDESLYEQIITEELCTWVAKQ